MLSEGVWAGQRLTLGRAGLEQPYAIDMDPESFASGPAGGTVLMGTDDGQASTLSLLDLASECGWTLDAADDVIRHATLSPDGRSVVEARVDRESRADLGVWRRPLDGRSAARILPPIDRDDRFGRTWRTELAWADDGRTLVVESCGEVACRYRLLDLANGDRQTLAEPSLGHLVGLVDGRLVAFGACRGLPCPLVSIDPGGGPAVILHRDSGRAVIALEETARPVVVHEVGADGLVLRAIRPDGRNPRLMDGDHDGRRLVAGPSWSDGAAEHALEWVLLGPDGRLDMAGGATLLRNVSDGRTVHLDEAPR
jgi:hypothetical protein